MQTFAKQHIVDENLLLSQDVAYNFEKNWSTLKKKKKLDIPNFLVYLSYTTRIKNRLLKTGRLFWVKSVLWE